MLQRCRGLHLPLNLNDFLDLHLKILLVSIELWELAVVEGGGGETGLKITQERVKLVLVGHLLGGFPRKKIDGRGRGNCGWGGRRSTGEGGGGGPRAGGWGQGAGDSCGVAVNLGRKAWKPRLSSESNGRCD